MRSFFAPLFVASALAFAITGCGAAPDQADDTTSSSEALSTLGQKLVGSYTRTSGTGAPNALTLVASGTFTASTNVVCVAAPCNPVASSGTWTTSGGVSYGTLRLATTNSSAVTYRVAFGSTGSVTLTTTDSRHLVSTFARVAVPELCGGIGALKCPTGKTCVYDDATQPDAAGKCYAQGARGTMCGGIGGLRCDTGLSCIIDSSGVADAAGICSAPGDAGTFCGGIGGLKCATGLTCVLTESGHTDLGGLCTKP
jgi:hypothetical protein